MRALMPKPTCEVCGDTGWLYKPELVPGPNQSRNAPAIRCACKKKEDVERKERQLKAFDGLTEAERQRRFSEITDNYEPGVLHKLKQSIDLSKGFITLTGKFGVGKTLILMSAVNEGRDREKLAIYTTVSDLLSYLRSTFNPDSEGDFDNYWEALIKCDILCLDEMDEFHTTGWAMERFLRLIDERWRRMDSILTICALNSNVRTLPGKVQSRLRDGRAEIIEIGGYDMRPANTWEDRA